MGKKPAKGATSGDVANEKADVPLEKTAAKNTRSNGGGVNRRGRGRRHRQRAAWHAWAEVIRRCANQGIEPPGFKDYLCGIYPSRQALLESMALRLMEDEAADHGTTYTGTGAEAVAATRMTWQELNEAYWSVEADDTVYVFYQWN